MKALSIRQPWAWLILNAGKNIENRDWHTSFRGRVLIHAAKAMTRDYYDDMDCVLGFPEGKRPAIEIPPFEDLQRGGIVGSVEIVDCVEHSESDWFFGRYGFVLRDPRPLPFIPYRGELGFFNVPDTLLAEGTHRERG